MAHRTSRRAASEGSARGKLAALDGDADRALREARASTALADTTEMFTFRADAHRDLAEVATRCDRHAEARAATATALALYGAKENVAAAAQLQARRRGLGPRSAGLVEQRVGQARRGP